ncbi:hypothetical protein [Myroides guanonis]|uniref:hypothetical protein n=1 Tax=Myroides guanonis TaxID=1150112 RepID=UPI001160D427|nr:hypothetical protein [Myroides guanonis]
MRFTSSVRYARVAFLTLGKAFTSSLHVSEFTFQQTAYRLGDECQLLEKGVSAFSPIAFLPFGLQYSHLAFTLQQKRLAVSDWRLAKKWENNIL